MDLIIDAPAGLSATAPLPAQGLLRWEPVLPQRLVSVGAVFLPQASWRAASLRPAVCLA
jgi:hypothetical protein